MSPFIALAVVAHAALLSLPTRPVTAVSTTAVHAAAMQVRVVDARVAVPTPAAPTALRASDPDATLPMAALAPAPSAPQHAALAPIEATPTVPIAAIEDVWHGLALSVIASDDDLFLARGLLAVPPAPMAPIVIDYPAIQADAGRYATELSLFIDERGYVVRVRVDGDGLPTALEQAARAAFLNARFRPGEVADGVSVKSRIRVEVVFDSRPPDQSVV